MMPPYTIMPILKIAINRTKKMASLLQMFLGPQEFKGFLKTGEKSTKVA